MMHPINRGEHEGCEGAERIVALLSASAVHRLDEWGALARWLCRRAGGSAAVGRGVAARHRQETFTPWAVGI